LFIESKKYATKYFPLTRGITKPGLLIIECKPDHFNANIKIFTDAKALKGVPVDKYGYEMLKSFNELG